MFNRIAPISLLLALLGLAVAGPHPPTPTEDCCKREYTTHAYHAHVVDNYLKLWYGDLTVLNSTLSPEISFHSDRFPSSSGIGSEQIQLNSSAAFGEFVESSREGFERYGFKAHYWLGEGNLIAIRWYLDGIIGGSSVGSIPTTLKPGDSITYNGTDLLVLNKCTGLVDVIDSAQDLITLFHNLGLTNVTV